MTEIDADLLEDYLEKYVAYLRDDGTEESAAEKTIQQKECVCQDLIDYIRAGDPVPDDDEEDPRVIDTERKYDSANTIRSFFLHPDQTAAKPYLSNVRSFLQFLASHLPDSKDQDKLMDIRDMLTTDRFPPGTFEADKQEAEFIPDEDIVEACNKAATPRAEMVIRFLYWTGCRIAEMRGLTVEDVDFETDVTGATIRVSKQRLEDGSVVHRTKSPAGQRTVELPNKAAEMLQDYIDCYNLTDQEGDYNWLFPMSVDTYRRTDVKQAFTKAEVKMEDGTSVVSPHWLRHQRNTRLRERYQDSKVARYMGHTDSDGGQGGGSDMTEHYTHYDPEEAQGLIDENWVIE